MFSYPLGLSLTSCNMTRRLRGCVSVCVSVTKPLHDLKGLLEVSEEAVCKYRQKTMQKPRTYSKGWGAEA